MLEIQYTVGVAKDLATIAFYAVGAYVAMSGLKAWRREHLGKAHYDLAKAILTLVYKILSEVHAKRSRFGMESFLKGESNNNVEFLPARDRHFEIVRRNHLLLDSRIRSLFTELEPLLVEAEVLFGPLVNVRESVAAIDSRYLGLVSATHDYLGPGADGLADLGDSMKALKRILYRKGNQPGEDKFDNEFQASIKCLESILVPYLRK